MHPAHGPGLTATGIGAELGGARAVGDAPILGPNHRGVIEAALGHIREGIFPGLAASATDGAGPIVSQRGDDLFGIRAAAETLAPAKVLGGAPGTGEHCPGVVMAQGGVGSSSSAVKRMVFPVCNKICECTLFIIIL